MNADATSDTCANKLGREIHTGLSDVKAFLLAEKVEALMRSSKYVEALSGLRSLLPTQEGYLRLKTHLLMAECYLQLRNNAEAENIVTEMKQKISTPRHINWDEVTWLRSMNHDDASNSSKQHHDVTSDGYVRLDDVTLNEIKVDDVISNNMCADDVMTLCEYYSTVPYPVRVCVLLQIASMLYKRDSTPDRTVEGICNCLKLSRTMIEKMAVTGERMSAIAAEFTLPGMHRMLKDMGRVKGADTENKAINETKGSIEIGRSHQSLNSYTEEMACYKKGIQIMRSQFASAAANHKIFGILLSQCGDTSLALGSHDQAESFYLRSLDAIDKAEDWVDDTEKIQLIENVRNKLDLS